VLHVSSPEARSITLRLEDRINPSHHRFMNFHTRKWVKPEDLNPNQTLFGGKGKPAPHGKTQSATPRIASWIPDQFHAAIFYMTFGFESTQLRGLSGVSLYHIHFSV